MRPFPKAQPDEYMSLVAKSDRWDFVERYSKLAHFLIFVDMPGYEEGTGMIFKPVQIGEYTPQQFRTALKRLAIKPKQAKLLAQLYAAATAAAEAGLYEPAPPARLVYVQATRNVPWPDAWKQI